MPTHKPLILNNAGFKLGDGATPTEALRELACDTTHIELQPETSVTTVETMCGSTDYPGVTKWSLIATLAQSFDPDATEEVLSEAYDAGVPVSFEVVGDRDAVVSATNPMWSGKVIPEPHAPINGDAGDVSTVELDWAVVGEPVKSTTPAAVTAAAGAKA